MGVVSDQIHGPAALPTKKVPPLPTEKPES